ncbi:MAG: hypothetical protein EZS28_044327, partial [Streblomastix strix]
TVPEAVFHIVDHLIESNPEAAQLAAKTEIIAALTLYLVERGQTKTYVDIEDDDNDDEDEQEQEHNNSNDNQQEGNEDDKQLKDEKNNVLKEKGNNQAWVIDLKTIDKEIQKDKQNDKNKQNKEKIEEKPKNKDKNNENNIQNPKQQLDQQSKQIMRDEIEEHIMKNMIEQGRILTALLFLAENQDVSLGVTADAVAALGNLAMRAMEITESGDIRNPMLKEFQKRGAETIFEKKKNQRNETKRRKRENYEK